MKTEIMMRLIEEGMAKFVQSIRSGSPKLVPGFGFATHWIASDKDGFAVCTVVYVDGGLQLTWHNHVDRPKQYARIRHKIKRRKDRERNATDR